MQETQDLKAYFYVDESGDPTILGRKGRNLLAEGLVSKTFIVGYVETLDPAPIAKALTKLRSEIMADEYLAGIPSLAQTSLAFHANADCWEVKERMFKLLKQTDFKAYIMVARKDEQLFRRKFDLDPARLYTYLVAKLFENRLHKYKSIDIYFSAMGNTVRIHTMREAINQAIAEFRGKWGKDNSNEIRVFVQQASQIPLLQVVDYALWTVHRAYEKGDFRFYNFMMDKISMVQDIFDTKRYPNTYYTPAKPLEAKKISPLGG